MLYGIDGKPLSDQKELETRIYHTQLMNMILYLQDTLKNVSTKSSDAIAKMEGPDHRFEMRVMKYINELAEAAIKVDTIAGFVGGTQARLAYEICDRLVTEARLFDAEGTTESTTEEIPATTECEDLIRELIKRMLDKLAPEEPPAVAVNESS